MIAVMPRRTLYFLVFGAMLAAQLPPGTPEIPNPNAPNILRTPDGRNRTEMILKADHEASLKDLEGIRKLTEEVKAEMEKHDRHVLSVGNLKKLEEIEKLAKRVRGRMKRY